MLLASAFGVACAGAALARPGSATPLPRSDAALELHQRLLAEPRAGVERRVALTLDACSGRTDRTILDLLVERSIPATVFVTARWLAANPDAVRILQAHPWLFEIENHGARHRPAIVGPGRAVYGIPAHADADALAAEIDGGAQAIVAAGFASPRWYRGATAVYDPPSIDAIGRRGLRIAGFSVNADAGATRPRSGIERALDAVQGGDIVIAHLNHPEAATGAALAAALPRLVARGLVFVPLADLELQDRAPTPVATTARADPRRRASRVRADCRTGPCPTSRD